MTHPRVRTWYTAAVAAIVVGLSGWFVVTDWPQRALVRRPRAVDDEARIPTGFPPRLRDIADSDDDEEEEPPRASERRTPRLPTPRLPAAEGAWPVDTEGLRAALRAQQDDLRECNEAWLAEHAGGRLDVQFRIDRDPSEPRRGVVTDVTVQAADTTDYQPLETCIAATLDGAAFAAPPAAGIGIRTTLLVQPVEADP